MNKQKLYEAAALAYCMNKWKYPEEAYVPGGREKHIQNDVNSVLEEGWVQPVVDSVVREIENWFLHGFERNSDEADRQG